MLTVSPGVTEHCFGQLCVHGDAKCSTERYYSTFAGIFEHLKQLMWFRKSRLTHPHAHSLVAEMTLWAIRFSLGEVPNRILLPTEDTDVGAFRFQNVINHCWSFLMLATKWPQF